MIHQNKPFSSFRHFARRYFLSLLILLADIFMHPLSFYIWLREPPRNPTTNTYCVIGNYRLGAGIIANVFQRKAVEVLHGVSGVIC